MLRRAVLVFALAVSGLCVKLEAQKRNPPTAPPACRAWAGKSMLGPKDSVITTYVLVSPDGKSWTEHFPNRDPIPAKMLASGGDSVVMEFGPYSSITRPGQMVTTRTVGHIKGREMTGTFEAHFASGDVIRGKHVATCKQ
jgi:hypothetical protein